MEKNKKTKITHITRFAYPHIGGVEAVIKQINESLPDEEFEKEVFCCSNTEKSSFENSVKYNRCRYLFDFAANSISPQLFFRMVGLKTDIIHFHMPVIQNVVIWFILYHLGLIKYKKNVLIIEKRNHIGGNCYTENKDNIDIHKYGSHQHQAYC